MHFRFCLEVCPGTRRYTLGLIGMPYSGGTAADGCNQNGSLGAADTNNYVPLFRAGGGSMAKTIPNLYALMSSEIAPQATNCMCSNYTTVISGLLSLIFHSITPFLHNTGNSSINRLFPHRFSKMFGCGPATSRAFALSRLWLSSLVGCPTWSSIPLPPPPGCETMFKRLIGDYKMETRIDPQTLRGWTVGLADKALLHISMV